MCGSMTGRRWFRHGRGGERARVSLPVSRRSGAVLERGSEWRRRQAQCEWRRWKGRLVAAGWHADRRLPTEADRGRHWPTEADPAQAAGSRLDAGSGVGCARPSGSGVGERAAQDPAEITAGDPVPRPLGSAGKPQRGRLLRLDMSDVTWHRLLRMTTRLLRTIADAAVMCADKWPSPSCRT